MGSEPTIHKVKGAWVNEPFVTFDEAEMVLYAEHQRIVEALEAQVAALSRPVTLAEWEHAYHVCGSVGHYMDMDNVSELIAARLKQEPEEPK
jgi:hypothetical protein